jgi:hypothetical protein
MAVPSSSLNQRRGPAAASAEKAARLAEETKRMIAAINSYGESASVFSLIEEDDSQEVLLLAFTDSEIVNDVMVGERGLLPAEAMKAVIAERRRSVTALRAGAL